MAFDGIIHCSEPVLYSLQGNLDLRVVLVKFFRALVVDGEQRYAHEDGRQCSHHRVADNKSEV